MRDPKLKGIWRCTICDNIEAHEREVNCWECGKGQMVYVNHETVARALRVYVRPLPVPA